MKLLRLMLATPWICLLAAGSALAEPAPPAGAEAGVKAEVPSAEVVESARTAVAKLGTEVVAGNYQYGVDRMFPLWKTRMAAREGGMPQLNAKLLKTSEEMQKSGVTFLSSKPIPQAKVQTFEVSDGKKVEMIGGRQVETLIYTKWLVLVPTITQIRWVKNGQTFIIDKNGFQVAISDKSKNDWTFIDGSSINLNDLRSLFPNFPADTKLPSLEAKTQ